MGQKNPEWLTLDFLEHCVRSKEKYKGLTVTSFTAAAALPPGSNYGSIILRAAVRARDELHERDKTLSLIVKCPLVQGAISEIFNDIFDCESLFYNKFLPLGYTLLNCPFAPENFRSPLNSVVVLEDLKEKGYSMVEKGKQLDYDHCRSYFIAAAAFHAVSFCVQKRDPELIQRLGRERLLTNGEEMVTKTNKNMIRYGLEMMADRVSEFSKDQRIIKILKECSTKLWDILVDAIKPNEEFNSLNQGDPWATNMMFRYDDDGKAIEAKLLDFQGPRYTSPVSDLVYFLWTSADLHVLKNSQEELYEIYLEQLNSHLAEMRLEERLRMTTVREHRGKLSALALMVAEIGPPMLLKPSFTDINAMYSRFREDYEPEENPYKDLYSESYSKNHLPGLIEQLKTSGIFDNLESQVV